MTSKLEVKFDMVWVGDVGGFPSTPFRQIKSW